MPTNLVGRTTELASLRDFLAGVSEGASALVLRGEAGVGKTTLWRACVLEAEEYGLRVLRVSPAESETALSFCGIGDLLDPVLDEALAPLLPGHKRALSRALALDEEEGLPPDPHAVGVAFLNALRRLADARPLVVAVDDVQWLDAASAGAFGYAARRLRGERVGVLLSYRLGLDTSLLDELRRALSDGRVTEVEVGPLDVGELHQIVQDHLGMVLPRPLLGEVHQASGGNPFYALEIVRMLRRTGFSVEAGQPLPVPESLYDLVHGRLLALPGESRDFLLAAAAHAHPTTSVTEAASGVERGVGLAPALESHIVELDGQQIRFTHPLLAAGVYETADPLRRAAVHARLAELLEDPEARAWQLAASVDQPDETVAAVLEQAASHARARGAPRSAALLLERASALTPHAREMIAGRRALAAGSAHHEAGDTDRARALLEQALACSQPGHERAEVLVALARVRSYGDDLRAASALDMQAIDEAEPGSLVEAVAQVGLSGKLLRLRERLAEALELSGKAAITARVNGAAQLEAESLAMKAISEAVLARPEAVQTSEAALALQASCAAQPILRQPGFTVTIVRFWHDDLVGARHAYEEMAALADDRGDESSLPYILIMLGQIECALGRFENALERAAAGQSIAEPAGQRMQLGYALAVRAVAEAHLGRIDDARRSATAALELAQATSGVAAWIFASWALGHAALSLGNAAGALESFTPLLAQHDREEVREPGALPFMSDAIEALVEVRRVEEARRALDTYEATAERLGRKRGIAAARRCRGLLAAAAGDPAGALGELEAAVELASRETTPFERARSLLALGVTQRRAKRRREGRKTLEEALGIFERIGAALWAERTRAELSRLSGRAASPEALTPAEERVAVLVAEGKTNREVAAALFLSERTVEGHLTHVFAKLGVRSRTELAHVRASGTTQVVASSNPGDSHVL